MAKKQDNYQYFDLTVKFFPIKDLLFYLFVPKTQISHLKKKI